MSTNPGTELAAKRKTIEHTCPICGKVFMGIKIAKTCSEACKQKLKRNKKAKMEIENEN